MHTFKNDILEFERYRFILFEIRGKKIIRLMYTHIYIGKGSKKDSRIVIVLDKLKSLRYFFSTKFSNTYSTIRDNIISIGGTIEIL